MSGKPQFDEAEVIRGAVGVFWRHGYAAASISDLSKATGLSRSSLYQRFGDKDGLFQEALAAYTERVLRRMASTEGAGARAQIHTLLLAFLPDPAAPRPTGCLIARSCAELVDLPPAGQMSAKASAERQRAVFLALLQDGVSRSELSPQADIDALSWHFLGTLQAVLNFAGMGAGDLVLRRMIEAAMAAWPHSIDGVGQPVISQPRS